MSTTRSASPKAPATEPARAALLICSHGVGGRPGAAEAHARTLRRRGDVAHLLGRAAGPVAYAGPVGVRPGMADLVLEVVAETAPLRPESPGPAPMKAEEAGAGMGHPLPAALS